MPKKTKKKTTRRGSNNGKNGAKTRKRRLIHKTLTKEVIEEFELLVSEGVPTDAVCAYIGISETSFHTWIRRGKMYEDADGSPVADAIYFEFYNRYRRAGGKFRVEAVRKIRDSKDWTRWMTLMERRDRRNFGRFQPIGGEPEEYDPSDEFL